MAGVFFSVGLAVFQASDLIGDLHELLGQFLEELVIGHIASDLLSVVGGNTFRALASLEITLQHVIQAFADRFSAPLGGKKLLA